MNMDKKEGDGQEGKQNKIPHHGYNVRHYRRKRHFSQEYVALKAGITQPRLSELEGKEVIDDETLEKLAAALELHIDYLKDDDTTTPETTITQTGESSILNSFNENLEVNQSKTINNPVETEAYLITIEELRKAIEDYRLLNQQLSNKNDQLVQQVIDFSNEMKTTILSSK